MSIIERAVEKMGKNPAGQDEQPSAPLPPEDAKEPVIRAPEAPPVPPVVVSAPAKEHAPAKAEKPLHAAVSVTAREPAKDNARVEKESVPPAGGGSNVPHEPVKGAARAPVEPPPASAPAREPARGDTRDRLEGLLLRPGGAPSLGAREPVKKPGHAEVKAPPRPVAPAAPREPARSAAHAPVHAPMKEPPHAHTDTLAVPRDTVKGGARVSKDGETIVLQAEALQAKGFVAPGGKHAQISEEFRYIKRPLLTNAFGDNALPEADRNVVLVTSALPGEGKTFTALNLALSIALDGDRTVILVDADVTHPSVHRELQFSAHEGLAECLSDHTRHAQDFLLHTSVTQLWILPGGRLKLSAAALAGQRMEQLVRELALQYPDAMVILDAPSLLATGDTRALAALAGQVVVVVEANRTGQNDLNKALALLGGEKYIGLVLNKSGRPFGVAHYPAAHGEQEK